jgi:hypothetical protein
MTMMSVITERTQWAGHIAAAWQKSVDVSSKLGVCCLRLKQPPRCSMVSGGPWSRAICPSLYELTKLDDDTFDQKLRDGTIHPDMQRKDAGRRPVENLAPIRRTGSRGEQVSAISARSARDPEDPGKLRRSGRQCRTKLGR